jgi:hypothetical protein
VGGTSAVTYIQIDYEGGSQMPNWCRNVLTVRGDDQIVREFDQAFKGRETEEEIVEMEKVREEEWEGAEQVYSFNALYPVPDEVHDRYSWCNLHWGTKWDICGQRNIAIVEPGYAEYNFSTAWSPPAAWLAKVARDWPDLDFELSYYEPGCCFAGSHRYSEGKLVSEEELGGDLRDFVIEKMGYYPFDES